MNNPSFIPPGEQALALATKRAIQAAGGLSPCQDETGTSDSQLSRCCSPNLRDSITIRDAVTIESIGHGPAGHPFILKAMARQLGFVVIPLPESGIDAEGLAQSVMELAAETGDVAQAIREALQDHDCNPDEAAKALIQLDELDQASAKLRLKLNPIAAKREAGR